MNSQCLHCGNAHPSEYLKDCPHCAGTCRQTKIDPERAWSATQSIEINRFGINLRQLVALLDCQKSEASEYHVMVEDRSEGKLYSLKVIRVEPESETVWLQVGEY